MSYLRNYKLNHICQNIRLISHSSHLENGIMKENENKGSVRIAETAKEQAIFYRKQREQLAKLKRQLHNKIHFHEEQIKKHEMVIKRHEEKVMEFEKKIN